MRSTSISILIKILTRSATSWKALVSFTGSVYRTDEQIVMFVAGSDISVRGLVPGGREGASAVHTGQHRRRREGEGSHHGQRGCAKEACRLFGERPFRLAIVTKAFKNRLRLSVYSKYHQ